MRLLLKSNRKRITEGQIVTYRVRGKMRQYKKIAGKMVYQGTVEETKKKTIGIKKETKKPVLKMSKEQKEVFKDVGIYCKDDNALSYVKDQMKAIFSESLNTEISDYSKLPKYIRNITIMNSNSAKYTPNKIWINWENFLWQEKKLEINMFEGIPDSIKPVFDIMKKEQGDNIDILEKKIALEKTIRELSSKATRTRNDIYNSILWAKKELSEEDQEKYKYVNPNYFFSFSNIEDGKELLEDFNKLVDQGKLDFLTENRIKNIRNEYKWTFEAMRDKEEKRKEYNNKYGNIDHQKRENARKSVIKQLKKLSKQDPKIEPWLKGLYVAFFLNRNLLKRGRKIGYKKIAIKEQVKGSNKFFTASEAIGISTNDQARAAFISKRVKNMTSESAKKKLKNLLSDEGDETKTFSLSTCSPKVKEIINRKIKETYDKENHGSFGVKIHNTFQIGDAEYYKKYKQLEKEIGNVVFSYHGTSFDSAARIARGGFKITKPKTGRMIGDGIYGAKNSSKSLQYLKGYTRKEGTRGVLFVCKNALGKVKILTASEVGKRNVCNQLMKEYDTLYAKKGIIYGYGGGQYVLLNDEWVGKEAQQMIPMYWIDVELTNPNSKENIAK